MNDTNIGKITGRPRSFSKEKALEKALEVFCEYGYEGASLSKLTSVMGINSPSLYSAFGDKEQLFLTALGHYCFFYYDKAKTILFGEPDTFKAFEKLLRDMAQAFADDISMTGCLVVNSTVNNNTHNQEIAKRLRERHADNEKLLVSRLEKGLADGDIAECTNCLAVARYVNGIRQGAAVLIRGQQSQQAVNDLIDQALIGLKAMLACK